MDILQPLQKHLNYLTGDPSHLNNTYPIILAQLTKQFPDATPEWLQYWASSITLLSLGNFDEMGYEITFHGSIIDPKVITITLIPDYGS